VAEAGLGATVPFLPAAKKWSSTRSVAGRGALGQIEDRRVPRPLGERHQRAAVQPALYGPQMIADSSSRPRVRAGLDEAHPKMLGEQALPILFT